MPNANRGLISNDASLMYKQAAALGAAPDPASLIGQIDQQRQHEQEQAQQQAQQIATAIERSRSVGSFTPDEYTETIHGLQALPHIEND